MFLHRRSPGRLAVLLAVFYGTLALGGSSLHNLLDHFPSTTTDRSAAHDRLTSTVSDGHSHDCLLCHYLVQGQLPGQHVLVAATELVREIERNAPPGLSPLAIPLSIQPRAPPR